MKILFIIYLGILIIQTVLSAQTIEDYESKLTNNDYQTWVLDTIDIHLGTQDCDGGIIYSFILSKKTGIRKECNNNKWISTFFNWEIIKKPESEFYLIIKSFYYITESFEIDFILRNKKLLLRLREPLNSDVSIKTKDYYFYKN
jgi:hypothetical protein